MGTQTNRVGGTMTGISWARTLRGAGVLAVLTVVGCGGTAEGGAVTTADLTMDDGGLPLLDESSTEAWWLAPPGCEGLLLDEVSMAIASLEHGLIAVLDPTGHIVCVDTVEAVGEELDELGRHDDAAVLSSRFDRSSGPSAPAASRIGRSRITADIATDPVGCWDCGDPNPEPNDPVPAMRY